MCSYSVASSSACQWRVGRFEVVGFAGGASSTGAWAVDPRVAAAGRLRAVGRSRPARESVRLVASPCRVPYMERWVGGNRWRCVAMTKAARGITNVPMRRPSRVASSYFMLLLCFAVYR